MKNLFVLTGQERGLGGAYCLQEGALGRFNHFIYIIYTVKQSEDAVS